MDFADLLAVAKNITHGAVIAVARILDSLLICRRQDVLLPNDRSARFGQFIDPVELHVPTAFGGSMVTLCRADKPISGDLGSVAKGHHERAIVRRGGTALEGPHSQPMAGDPIMNMRARVAQCRLLAQHTSDSRTAKILLQMADEGEQDIERLEKERTRDSDAQ